MSPPARPEAQARVLRGFEGRLLGPLRELVLLLQYRHTQRYLDWLLACVLREMYRDWDMSQQEIADAVGLSRGRVQQILADNLRQPDLDDHLPELRLLLLTQMSAAPGPLPHEAIVQRLRHVYGPRADAREIAARSLSELHQLVKAGTLTMSVADTGAVLYRLDPRHAAALPMEPADVAIPRLREEIGRHLDFHEETAGRTGIGLRARHRWTADITRSLGLEMDARIRDAVGAILAEFEARAEEIRAGDPDGREDPELPVALFFVASHVALQPLDTEPRDAS